MVYYLTKLTVTAVLVVLISEIAKRSALFGALLASVPLVSVLAMTWLYVETRDIEKILRLSHGVFWLVIPSLALFVTLPLLLKKGLGFYSSLALSLGVTAACYWLMVVLLARFGIRL